MFTMFWVLDFLKQYIRRLSNWNLESAEFLTVELKAVAHLDDAHRSQIYNYLKATGHKLGLLFNFGHYDGLEWERKLY